jgi:hypothetical protein
MTPVKVDEFLARLIGDVEFRQSFFIDPLSTCAEDPSELTWSEIAALLCIAEPMLAEFARATPSPGVGSNFFWKDDTTNKVGLKSH